MKPERVDVCVATLTKPPTAWEEHLKERIPVKDIIYDYARPLGTARQNLINNVSTDWFVFVDTDVWLYDNWWNIISSYVDGRTGAVDGSLRYSSPSLRAYQEAMAKLASLLRKRNLEVVPRAFTGDTLIKTSLVSDIRIPSMRVYEDEFIRRHVILKGFEWKRTKEIICDHDFVLEPREAIDTGTYAYYFHKLSLRRALRNMLTIFPKAAFATATTGELRVIREQLQREYMISIGVLKACAGCQLNAPTSNKSPN